jgi:hypothetical protein
VNRRGTFARVLLLTAFCSACSVVRLAKEPGDAELRETFERHRQVMDELRRLFEEDEKRHGLLSVAATDTTRSVCKGERDGESCLSSARWTAYATRLRYAGIEWIGRYETPGTYFHVYRTPFWSAGSSCFVKGEDYGGCFRFRGFVYAPGHPTVDHTHDDFETRIDLGGGWYSYLIIDT